MASAEQASSGAGSEPSFEPLELVESVASGLARGCDHPLATVLVDAPRALPRALGDRDAVARLLRALAARLLEPSGAMRSAHLLMKIALAGPATLRFEVHRGRELVRRSWRPAPEHGSFAGALDREQLGEAVGEARDGDTVALWFDVRRAPSPAPPAASALESRRVLLVAANPLERDAVGRRLWQEGAWVCAASSSTEAMRFAGATSFDAAIVDGAVLDRPPMDLAASLAPIPCRIALGGSAEGGVAPEGVLTAPRPLSTARIVAALAESGSERARGRETLAGASLLVADDDADARALVAARLRGSGCTVQGVASGREALERMRLETFDLVILDLAMPGLDGEATARSIRQREREQARTRVPILLLSAHEAEDGRRRALAADCDAHLPKSAKLATFLAAVHRAVGARDGGSEPPAIDDLIDAYLARRREDLVSARAALEASGFETLRVLGHRLHGSGGGYGFPPLSAIGRGLEEAAQREDCGLLAEWIRLFETYLDEVSDSSGKRSR